MKSAQAIRILSVVLSLFLVVGIVSLNKDTVQADTDITTGLVYTVAGGEATITGFTAPAGFDGTLEIPDALGGEDVTGIGDGAFYYCESLTGITIPSTVLSIGSEAFKDCYNLTGIIIPHSVTSIGDRALVGCSRMISLSVAASNTVYKNMDNFLLSKDGSELLGCPGGISGSITIPSGVTSIGSNAFYGCSKLTGVTIPSGVTSVGSYAFFQCSGLTGITIPGSITTLETFAFSYCDGMTMFTVDAANTVYKSTDGFLLSIDGTELICCPGGKTGNITIPSGVASIGEASFIYCYALTGVMIPDSVTSIGRSAFYGCSGLTAITIPSGVTSIDGGAFYSCRGLSDVYFYCNAPTLGINVFYDCTDDFAVHYLNSRTGYTNPWNGYPAAIFSDDISYQTHVQDVGWQAYVSNGAMSGTSGESNRLEAIRIKLELEGISGGIEYRTHVQDIGWQGWVANDVLSGTSGQSKRLEAIQIRLTGEGANVYDVYYRVHAQNTGWMDWARNGESSGTAGFSYRLEAIEVKLVPKGDPAPGPTTRPFIDLNALEKVSYKTHVQDVGWQDYVSNGAESGTSGQSKRLEGIQIKLENIAGGIEYSTHIQDIGWQGFVANDAMSGTSGQSKRLEAIKIRLTGAAADVYDVYYCVHAQNTGWLDWARNGESAGTAGFSYRLEAIKIVLVPKGGPAPGATARAFVQG